MPGPAVVTSAIEPSRIDLLADTNASAVAAHAEAAADVICDGLEGSATPATSRPFRFARRVAWAPT